jgi:hypothetical protein
VNGTRARKRPRHRKHSTTNDGQTNATQRFVRKRVASLKPSPENQHLYRPTGLDPDIGALAVAIDKNGCDPLTVTADNYVVSGHRRLAALEQIGQRFVLCKVLPQRREDMSKDAYIRLLREFNHQRNKTIAEQVCEAMVDVNPEDAHSDLMIRRLMSRIVPAEVSTVCPPLEIEGSKRRAAISEDKAEHVRLTKEIVEALREYWPLSVRAVHYQLLNHDFIRGYYWPRSDQPGHGTRQELRYKNDDNSYGATSELITRLRLNKQIPWEALDDGTRPLKEFHAFRNVREFVKQEVGNLFGGYWRDLLQTQPHHVECVCEKNTVYQMVLKVTERYQIPTSSGRGFCSIDPWHDLYERFQASGKDRLILIVLSDYDPEGEQIVQAGGRTLRDDFGVPEDELVIIKAGVTREQIERYRLPAMNFAKESSSNRDWFVQRNGGDDSVYELEALDPRRMLEDLDYAIRMVIDIDLFNREVAAERDEAAYLEAARRTAAESLKGLGE